MATALAGHAGSVIINGTPVTTVALIDNWSATLTAAQYDETSLGDSWTKDVAGLKTMTGTLAGKWDVTSDPGQTTLHNAILNGTTVGLNLTVDGSNGYDLTANVDSFATTDPVAGLVTFTCNFRSYGQVFFN